MTVVHTLAEIVFWACLVIVVYTYALYPVLLFFAWALSQLKRDWHYLLRRCDRRSPRPSTVELPRVSMVIAAHNEQEALPAKLENIRQLDYPKDKLDVIFVSDGSTDATNSMLSAVEDANVASIQLPERGGKSRALNTGVARASTELLVFSDAATQFAPDALRMLVRHFIDREVGMVCGALQFQAGPESKQTEGVYWKYESMLRLMESRLGATLTASGAVYALRRDCFAPLPDDTMVDDIVTTMNAHRLGYKVVYDPEATALEFAPDTIKGEFSRRVRLAIGSFRNLKKLMRAPLGRFARLAFLSHKVLRWVVPFLLILLLISTAVLWKHPLYRAALFAQFALYLWAAGGYLLHAHVQKVRFALLGYFVVAMNIAFLVGFFRLIFGRTEASWERAH